MAETVTVRMARGETRIPWGFGVTETPSREIVIVNVIPGSLADRAGLRNGDVLDELEGLRNLDILATDRLLVTSRNRVELVVHRFRQASSNAGPISNPMASQVRTWQPDVRQETRRPIYQEKMAGSNGSNDVRVSLEHSNKVIQPHGFNTSATPFINDPRVRHAQYNSPLSLYSPANAAEQYEQQTRELSEKSSRMRLGSAAKPEDPAFRSETMRLIQEETAAKAAVRNTSPSLVGHPNPNGLPVCFVCQRPILGVMARAAGHEVHGDCLSCTTCGASLRNIGHHFIDERFYCDVHAAQKQALLVGKSVKNVASKPEEAPRAMDTGRAFYQPEHKDQMSRRVFPASSGHFNSHSTHFTATNVHISNPKTQGPISPAARGVPTNHSYLGTGTSELASSHPFSAAPRAMSPPSLAPPPPPSSQPPSILSSNTGVSSTIPLTDLGDVSLETKAQDCPVSCKKADTSEFSSQQARLGGSSVQEFETVTVEQNEASFDNGRTLTNLPKIEIHEEHKTSLSAPKSSSTPKTVKLKEAPPRAAGTLRAQHTSQRRASRSPAFRIRRLDRTWPPRPSAPLKYWPGGQEALQEAYVRSARERRAVQARSNPRTPQNAAANNKPQKKPAKTKKTTLVSSQNSSHADKTTSRISSSPLSVEIRQSQKLAPPSPPSPISPARRRVAERHRSTGHQSDNAVKHDQVGRDSCEVIDENDSDNAELNQDHTSYVGLGDPNSMQSEPLMYDLVVEAETEEEDYQRPPSTTTPSPNTKDKLNSDCYNEAEQPRSPVIISPCRREEIFFHRPPPPYDPSMRPVQQEPCFATVSPVLSTCVQPHELSMHSRWCNSSEIIDEADLMTEPRRSDDEEDAEVIESVSQKNLLGAELKERGNGSYASALSLNDDAATTASVAWRQEAMQLIDVDGQWERDLEMLGEMSRRMSGDVEKMEVLQGIERHQAVLEQQQEQLSGLLDSAIVFLRALENAPRDSGQSPVNRQLLRSMTDQTYLLNVVNQCSRMSEDLVNRNLISQDLLNQDHIGSQTLVLNQYLEKAPVPPLRTHSRNISFESLTDVLEELRSMFLPELTSISVSTPLPAPPVLHPSTSTAGIPTPPPRGRPSFSASCHTRQRLVESNAASQRRPPSLSNPTPTQSALQESSASGKIPYCEQCSQAIRGAFVLAGGKSWCPEHFVCANKSCARRLLECGFVEENGLKYCEGCFEKHIAPRCSKCNTAIISDCLNALQKKWHPSCFTCAHCQAPFGNSAFYLEQGQPYCEKDWNLLFTTKCVACRFPIEAGDRWVEALGSAYHSNCFTCTKCRENLEGESFYAKNGQPYCKQHA